MQGEPRPAGLVAHSHLASRDDVIQKAALLLPMSVTWRASGSGFAKFEASIYDETALAFEHYVADLLSSFRAALADRYTMERELGRGGMATGLYPRPKNRHSRLP